MTSAACSACRRPTRATPAGESYTFEAGAERTSTGRRGWADVWKRELLRLGVQGRARRPRRRLPPAARLPRGPREPARARRQRHGPDRGPHQLHGHPPRGAPHHPRRPRGRRRAHGRGVARAPRRHARPRGAAARADARRDHRARRGALRRDRPLDARSRLPPGGRRPPPQPRRLLPLRPRTRGCSRSASSPA